MFLAEGIERVDNENFFDWAEGFVTEQGLPSFKLILEEEWIFEFILDFAKLSGE